jgi:hypothetical protein
MRTAGATLVAVVLIGATSACGSSSPAAPALPSASASASSSVFTLGENGSRAVCGISVGVSFDAADPVLFTTTPPTVSVHPVQGVVVTLAGRRFGVNAIDRTNRTIQLTPLCDTTP